MTVPLLPTPPDDAVSISAPPSDRSPAALLIVRIFFTALGLLLLGYMFMGRGFAHLGTPPLYVGEVVLALGLIAAAVAIVVRRPSLRTWRIEWLLVAFMAVGALRTLPYIPEHGLDALRDGTLWGYGLFTLIVVVLADRWVASRALHAFALVVPVFALWLPVAWNIFAAASADIDPNRPGEVVPLVFFKAGDMAVHIGAACAVFVLATQQFRSRREFIVRAALGVPLLWAAFISATSNRGSMLTFAAAIFVLAVLAGRRRNWLPLGASLALLVGGLAVPAALQGVTPGFDASANPRPQSTAPTGLDGSSGGPSRSPGSLGSPGASALPGSSGSSPTPGGELIDGSGRPISVPNPGFESGALNSGRIEGWTVSGVGTFNIVPGPAREGSRSAALTAGGTAYETWIRSGTFQFDSTDDLFVSVWARAIDGEPRLEIYVNWLDASDSSVRQDYVGSATPRPGGAWRLASGAVKPPDTAAAGQIQLWLARGEGVVVLDEVVTRAGDFVHAPPPPKGRPAQIDQFIENILSIFMPSSNRNLEGTKQFRLEWWGAIVDYTVFGDYFWTGKGFGVNLADSDGFQSTADGSLRAPHNSHLTVLARMGVPGFALWIVLQGTFALAVLRALLTHRRRDDRLLAAVAAIVLVYWTGAMVDTSFDPYLEGPQGGIWFWSIVGMGLVVIRAARRSSEA